MYGQCGCLHAAASGLSGRTDCLARHCRGLSVCPFPGNARQPRSDDSTVFRAVPDTASSSRPESGVLIDLGPVAMHACPVTARLGEAWARV